jgi:hypothetical protein
MDHMRTHWCAICGDEGPAGGPWFLIAENRWEDKLRILHRNDLLAAQKGIRSACSAAHVQELVVHWMTTGSLDYPFARVASEHGPSRRCGTEWPARDEIDTSCARQIGELAVDREGMKRILSDSPQSLKAILDALLDVLHRETGHTDVEVESGDEALYALSREM